jgi:hypothetical protein
VNGSEVWSLPVSTIHSGWPRAKTVLPLVVALLAWQYTFTGLGGAQSPRTGVSASAPHMRHPNVATEQGMGEKADHPRAQDGLLHAAAPRAEIEPFRNCVKACPEVMPCGVNVGPHRWVWVWNPTGFVDSRSVV